MATFQIPPTQRPADDAAESTVVLRIRACDCASTTVRPAPVLQPASEDDLETMMELCSRVLRATARTDPARARRLLERLTATVPSAVPAAVSPAPALVERLTPREGEVLRLLTFGCTNREIAEQLVISPGTAKVHVERIIAKLGVSDRTQAAVRAVELGMVARQSQTPALKPVPRYTAAA
jgi:DNA-binding CsgD family transcriptional regulator